MTSEATFVILFSIATGVAIATRNLRVPYTVALVIVGLALGSFHLMDAPHLTRELLFAVFLPGLLFDAAFQIEADEFWRNRLTIGSLAVPGVIVGTVMTGFIVTLALQTFGVAEGFRWEHGLVFGALVAATDPIAVIALFRTLNAPHRLRILVEGESLLNDGTSIVALTLILALVAGVSTSAVDVVRQFTVIVGGGVLIGGATGFVISKVTERIDDAMIEITLTTIAAYGSFVVAEQVHYSGVIATVTAGLICGNYGRRYGMSPSTQLAVKAFWEYLAFALNSVVFLLIGFDVGIGGLASAWKIIAIAFFAMIAARAALILGVTAILQRTAERIPFSWGIALTWSGLRGALSMVLALALPTNFPGRSFLIAMTFGVVIASIMIQGLTMPIVLRKLGIVNFDRSRLEYELARHRLQISTRLRNEVNRMRSARSAPPEVLDALERNYTERSEKALGTLSSMHRERDDLRDEAAAAAVEHMLRIEKTELVERLRTGYISQDAYDELLRDVDGRLIQLQQGNLETAEEILTITGGWRTVDPPVTEPPDPGSETKSPKQEES